MLLRAKIFPDSDDAANPLGNGDDATYDRVEYQYNRLGQVTGSRDQNETVHAYGYDKRGRQTADRVTALGQGVDGAVRRIETAYDNLDHVTFVTSYDAADGGNAINQVARTYNPFGRLAGDAQAHAGAAGAGSPAVRYHHDGGGDGTEQHATNSARLTEIVYPNGRVIRLGYGDTGSIDDTLSRPASVRDVPDSEPSPGPPWDIVTYAYLGADTAVISAYAEPEVELTYLKQGSETSQAGDSYAGLDQYGRIIDHRWMKDGADIERTEYGYNLGGLRQWRLDTLAHAAGAVDQDRTHTKVNEIKTFDGSGVPVVYDRAGNMTRMPKALAGTTYYEATWDAWNRLVRVKTPGNPGGYGSYSGTALNVKYAYDGMTRRTTREVVTGTSPGTTHYYYNAEWKCIEQRLDSTTVPYKQFVFGARGRNDLVFREQFEGPLSDRIYALCDNMGSKVAITDKDGTVTERYAFTVFSSRDPIGEEGGVNLYEFVGNDGVNKWDQLGLYSFGCGYGVLYEEGCTCPRPGKRDCEPEFISCVSRGVAVTAAYKITCEILCAPAAPLCKYYCGITAGEIDWDYELACDVHRNESILR